MAAGTAAAQSDEPKVTPEEAVAQAAALDGKKQTELPPEVEDAALAWFLDDEEPEFTRTVELNVGTDDDPKWVPWTIRALDADEIRRLNRQSEGNRAGRRGLQTGQERDPDLASRRIVCAATVKPDLMEVVKAKGIQPAHGDPLWAPMQVLAWRFRAKPGLIIQLANDVFGLSGYDDEDIRGVQAGKS
jgi:hypothetical protein